MSSTLLLLALLAPPSVDVDAALLADVERQGDRLGDLSLEIWHAAETALLERRSSEALASYAEERGFRVRRGVAGLPTAFVAEAGEGRPVIALLGEFDALPGLSQAAEPTRRPLVEGGAGHACGHNLFGAASLGAAAALKAALDRGDLHGTVRFLGCPAEEAVGGKLYMIRAGLFDDVDVVLAWHPGTETRSDTSGSQALVDLVVDFRGRAAHAAFDPWNGRSALDALMICAHALELLREHVRPTTRIHYVVTDGGGVPNVVPEHARLWVWLRASTHAEVDVLLARMRRIARGAALCADVEAELTVRSGDWEFLVNRRGQRLVQDVLERLGPIPFSEDEKEYARALQKAAGVRERGVRSRVEPFETDPGEPDGGSTDVADVSWVAPTLHLTVTTAPEGVPWHAWPVVAASGSALGRRGMMHAARALALVGARLLRDPAALAAVREEFEESTRDVLYRSYLPAGPPPRPKRQEGRTGAQAGG